MATLPFDPEMLLEIASAAPGPAAATRRLNWHVVSAESARTKRSRRPIALSTETVTGGSPHRRQHGLELERLRLEYDRLQFELRCLEASHKNVLDRLALQFTMRLAANRCYKCTLPSPEHKCLECGTERSTEAMRMCVVCAGPLCADCGYWCRGDRMLMCWPNAAVHIACADEGVKSQVLANSCYQCPDCWFLSMLQHACVSTASVFAVGGAMPGMLLPEPFISPSGSSS